MSRSSAWAQLEKARDDLFAGYKKWQRMTIVMRFAAKRQGVDLDKYLKMNYEQLTEALEAEMSMYTNEGKFIERDEPDVGVYGNDDGGWFVWFDSRNHGPFDSYEEADNAFNSMLEQAYGMTNLLRPEDYPDPNWCPDCGEPRGVCRCDEMQGDDWNEYYLNDDYSEPDFTLDDEEHSVDVAAAAMLDRVEAENAKLKQQLDDCKHRAESWKASHKKLEEHVAILVQWGNALALLAETQKDFYIEMAKIANIDSMPGEIEIVLTLAAWEQAKGDNHE